MESKKPSIPRPNYHFGLVGFPLGHSLSPILHAAALNALNLSGDYSLFPVPVDGGNRVRLSAILDQVRTGSLSGINITIPYKEIIPPFLEELTPVAQATGAVNTVYLQNGRLTGDNTDVAGFGLDLLDSGFDYQGNPGNALILGAGGAARAVVYALACAGWKVTLSARRQSQAETLCADIQRHLLTHQLSCVALGGIGLDWQPDQFALIVNATPLGMIPNTNFSPWPVEIDFPSSGFAYDLIYNPQETLFLKQARQAGLATRNGLGMLARQAAVAFERWTGIVPPFNIMWNSLSDFRDRH